MSTATQISTLESMVNAILAEDPAYFLVELRIKPINNIKIFLDGDNGITIEKCIAINRALYRQIEENAMYPDGNFSLEVSSPGLDEPLKSFRQYKKNIGRKVEVNLLDGRRIEGNLTDVQEQSIFVEETKGRNKKMEIIHHEFPFESIKSTKIQIVF